MNPKVLFLDHVGVLSGAELSLLDIARHHAGTSKVLLFSDGPFRERLEGAGVTVEVLPISRVIRGIRREGSGLRELRAAPEVVGIARRVAQMARGYDALYANSQKAFVIGALAGRLAGKPVIWHLRDMLTGDHFSHKHRQLVTTMANIQAARVIANSKATAAAFAKSGGRAGLARVVYNGIDPTPFESVTPAEVNALEEEIGLYREALVVSVFSRLSPWKGQHVLLEALVHLPDTHALLAGEALFAEHAYADSLREQAEILGIASRVHFLGFRRDVPRLMRRSDVVAHTSIAPEPFGRVIVEGMLARRPVVATRAGGAVEIVDDEVSGVLVPPGDAKALAAALAVLLADPEKAHAMARVGHSAALECFSLSTMVEGVTRQIQQVVAHRGRTGRKRGGSYQ